MPGAFLYIEILDPEVNVLITSICEILTGIRPKDVIHLTIRGPYEAKIPKSILKKCREVMRSDILKIEGVGRFTNPGEEVVFFKINSPNLRRIWWKRDYPIERYGFNPHITLYRGSDERFANLVAEFLERERIEVICRKYKLATRTRDQGELFRDTPRSEQLSGLQKSGRVSPTFLMRLEKLVSRSD